MSTRIITNGYKICKLKYKWKLLCVTIRGRPTAVKSLVFLWLYGNNDEILYGVFLRDTLYMKRDLKHYSVNTIVDLKCLETLNNRLRNTNLDIQCFETPNSVLQASRNTQYRDA